jgi:hypothetical protein
VYKAAKEVSMDLSVSLEPYAKDSADHIRNEYLDDLCKMAVRMERQIKAHPSDWTFGPWSNVNIQFPSLISNGEVVVDARLD